MFTIAASLLFYQGASQYIAENTTNKDKTNQEQISLKNKPTKVYNYSTAELTHGDFDKDGTRDYYLLKVKCAYSAMIFFGEEKKNGTIKFTKTSYDNSGNYKEKSLSKEQNKVLLQSLNTCIDAIIVNYSSSRYKPYKVLVPYEVTNKNVTEYKIGLIIPDTVQIKDKYLFPTQDN